MDLTLFSTEETSTLCKDRKLHKIPWWGNMFTLAFLEIQFSKKLKNNLGYGGNTGIWTHLPYLFGKHPSYISDISTQIWLGGRDSNPDIRNILLSRCLYPILDDIPLRNTKPNFNSQTNCLNLFLNNFF